MAVLTEAIEADAEAAAVAATATVIVLEATTTAAEDALALGHALLTATGTIVHLIDPDAMIVTKTDIPAANGTVKDTAVVDVAVRCEIRLYWLR